MPPARAPVLAGALAASLLALTACGDDASPAASRRHDRQGHRDRRRLHRRACHRRRRAGDLRGEQRRRAAGHRGRAAARRTRSSAEKENLTPGLSRHLHPAPGRRRVRRPVPERRHRAVDVHGHAASAASRRRAAAGDRALERRRVSAYRAYLLAQTASLVTATDAFTAAVKAGDVEQAKALYAPDPQLVRAHRAGSGDLRRPRPAHRRPRERRRPLRRVDRLPPPREGAVADRDLRGMAPSPTSCWPTSASSPGEMDDVELSAAQIANGAVGLLDEVAKSKITGEEERYSHTDLWDFAANLAGARQAFDVLGPVLREREPALLERRKVAVRRRRDVARPLPHGQRLPRLLRRDRRAAAHDDHAGRRARRDAQQDRPPGRMSVSRRGFLGGLGAAGAGVGLTAVAATAHASATAVTARTPPRACRSTASTRRDRHAVAGPLAFATFDVTTDDRAAAARPARRVDRPPPRR